MVGCQERQPRCPATMFSLILSGHDKPVPLKSGKLERVDRAPTPAGVTAAASAQPSWLQRAVGEPSSSCPGGGAKANARDGAERQRPRMRGMRDNPAPRPCVGRAWQDIRQPCPGARPGNLGQAFRVWDAGKGTGHLVDADLAWHLGQRVKGSWEVLRGVHDGLDPRWPCPDPGHKDGCEVGYRGRDSRVRSWSPGLGCGSSPCPTPGTSIGREKLCSSRGPGHAMEPATWAPRPLITRRGCVGLAAGGSLCPVLTSPRAWSTRPVPRPGWSQGLHQTDWAGTGMGWRKLGARGSPGGSPTWGPGAWGTREHRTLGFDVYFKGSGRKYF